MKQSLVQKLTPPPKPVVKAVPEKKETTLQKWDKLPLLDPTKQAKTLATPAKPVVKAVAKPVVKATEVPKTMESAIKSALPDVTEEDIASGDQDIENPLAMMYAAKH